MPRHPALARPDALVLQPTPLPSPLYLLRTVSHPTLRRRSIRASTCPTSLSMTCLPTLHSCTSNWTAAFRRSKRSETTQARSRKTRRRGVGIGCHSRSFWV
eukprot:1868095-Pleurochrysis_carterae.AAC.1